MYSFSNFIKKTNRQVSLALVALLFLGTQLMPVFLMAQRVSAVAPTPPDNGAADVCPDGFDGWFKPGNWVDSDKSDTYDSGSGNKIVEVCVKGGDSKTFYTVDTSAIEACWHVAGIGTQSVVVSENWENDEKGPECKDISHASFKVEKLETPKGSISGYKWNDENGDGNTEGEQKISGWTIFLDSNSDSILNNNEVSTTTGVDGTYTFTNLGLGTYTICEVMKVDWMQTYPDTQSKCRNTTLTEESPNKSGKTYSFGNKQVEEPVDYCDPADRPAGMSIAAWLAANQQSGGDCFKVQTAQECGYFNATLVEKPTGLNYEIRYVKGDTMPELADWEGDGVLPVNFPEDYNGGSIEITYYIVGAEKDYLVGTDYPNIWDGKGVTKVVKTDCEENNGSITVTKFNDKNQNGRWDEGESTLEGWEIVLEEEQYCNGVAATSLRVFENQFNPEVNYCYSSVPEATKKVTNEYGKVVFDDLEPRFYRVSETLKEGWTQSNIYCDFRIDDIFDARRVETVRPIGTLPHDDDSLLVFLYPSEDKKCYVGNYENPEPGIQVVKSGPVIAEAGTTVTYEFEVTNTGDMPLAEIDITDTITDTPVYVSGDTNSNDLLDLDETWLFEADYEIPEDQVASFTNVVTVCGAATFIERPEDDDDVSIIFSSQSLVSFEEVEGYLGVSDTVVCDQDDHTTFVPQVLGEKTDKGEVLAVKTLAKTGNNTLVAILIGLTIVTAALVMQKAVASDK